MGRFLNRIAAGLVASSVAIAPALLANAAPAHALTQSSIDYNAIPPVPTIPPPSIHWSIDYDNVVLGASAVNSSKAFDGGVESWYSGTGIVATVKGTFVGRGTLTATWTFHDGSLKTDIIDTDAGVQHDINFNSPLDRRVVKYNLSYVPNTGTVDSQTYFVGDSPKSTGSCTRLDNDAASIGPGFGGSFTGTVWYGCTSAGRVYAEPSGTEAWSGDAGVRDFVTFKFTYTDGTQEVKTTPSVSSSTPSATVGAVSNQTKDIEYVDISIGPWSGTSYATSSRFGDI